MSYWYGIGPNEIGDMPLPMIRSYLEELPARKAEHRIMLAEPLMLPHMDRDGRRRTTNRWERQAGVKRVVTPATKGALAGIGVGVRYA